MKHLTFLFQWHSHPAVLLIAATLLSSIQSGGAATPDSGNYAPGAQQFLNQAERCRRLLQTSLIEFYLPACLDQQNGGYLESLRGGRFAPTGEKFLTYQARQLWFFSTLAAEGYQKDEAMRAANAGFNFLQSKMLDQSAGGYYSKVTDAGAPRDTRKHIYLNSFALYGLAAYYRASRDPAALEAAQRLFRALDEHAYDRQHGGYNEFFTAAWEPITDPNVSGYVGAIGQKTYNTHLHLLESFAELYRIWPDELVARRLNELIVINMNTVRRPRIESNVDAHFRDWRAVEEPRNLRASYGHDVECVWLTLDAARTLGYPLDPFRNWSEALCRTSVEFGYDRQHGGFFSSGPLGKPADDLKKIWWVESEALVSMLDMFILTRDTRYYELFVQTLDFVEHFQVAKEGSWWATRAADGGATSDIQRTGPWQAGYHAGRAMILCAKRLMELGGPR